MTQPDLTISSSGIDSSPPAEESAAPLPSHPFSEQPPVLMEARQIESVLLAAVQQRLQRQLKEQIKNTLILCSVVLLGVLVWQFFYAIFYVLLGLFAVVVIGFFVISLLREWTRRNVDALERFQQGAEQERELIGKLLPFSRAALLHVAATARAAEGRVGNRVALVLGQNRAGGLLGLFLVVLGGITAGKYLEEEEVVIPWIDLPITPGVVLGVVFGLFALGATVLLAGHSLTALPQYAELLERVAALKKNLAEDAKEKT